MKKSCELCLELRPVVYCKADAAKLCLCCDAKVHSANTIVHHHRRALLCGSCKYRAADVECLDHRMFMCCVCDLSLHRKQSSGGQEGQHQKQTLISSYTGCPSAKEFAAFWGFKLHSDHVDENYLSSDCDTGNVIDQKSSSSSSSFVLDQILDLKRLQLTEGISPDSVLICGDQDKKTAKSSSSLLDHNTLRSFEDIHHHLPHQLQQSQIDHPFAFPFSNPMEHLSSSSPSFSSNFGFPMNPESFWQQLGKIPPQNTQLWSQNMQDLGVCEEAAYDPADPNTPDVDSKFQNFEESFAGEEDAAYSYSFMENQEKKQTRCQH